jgi:hypothetical protein
LHRGDGASRRSVDAAECAECEGRDASDAVRALRSSLYGARVRRKLRLRERGRATKWDSRRTREDAREHDIKVVPQLQRCIVVANIDRARTVDGRHRRTGGINTRLHHNRPAREPADEEVSDDVACAIVTRGRHRRADGIVMSKRVGSI